MADFNNDFNNDFSIMSRDVGKLEDILAATVARIIAQVSGFSTASCVLTLDPWELPAPNPGNPDGLFILVSPLSGSFPIEYLEGGGEKQTTALGGIMVVVHSPVVLDQPRQDGAFLTHASLGILSVVRQVLKSLTNWTPTNGSGELTRDPLLPASYELRRNERSRGAVGVGFHLEFDWDLT